MIFAYIFKKIKVNLILHRHNRHGLGNINLEINDDSINYININYIDKSNEDIEKNKNNISTNLIKINSNKDDTFYNLSEINYIKNDISKSYLKNVYNILYYNAKEKIDYDNNFYDKTFEFNAKENDFLEITLKMLLEYEYIDKSRIVIAAFKLINDNNKEIYVNTYHDRDDILYKNFVFLNKSIFYDFEKDTKKYEY